jgi:hypothetical protein
MLSYLESWSSLGILQLTNSCSSGGITHQSSVTSSSLKICIKNSMLSWRENNLTFLQSTSKLLTKHESGPDLEKSQFRRPQNLPAQPSGTSNLTGAFCLASQPAGWLVILAVPQDKNEYVKHCFRKHIVFGFKFLLIGTTRWVWIREISRPYIHAIMTRY